MVRLLKKGDKGPEVEQVQTLLMEKGYLTDEEINGVFETRPIARCGCSDRNIWISKSMGSDSIINIRP